MAANSVTQSGRPHILHGRVSWIIGGPFAVYYVRDGIVRASVTGILTPGRCDALALEYSRAYAAPIVSPNLSTASLDQFRAAA